MSRNADSMVAKLVDRVLPRMPDFFGMISHQSEHVSRSMDVFVRFMETGDSELGDEVRTMEKEGDELKSRHIQILNHAFATPMDREDIYRSIVTLDEILNYAKTTVREIEALDLQPDQHMAEMARQIRDGSVALCDGYRKLATKPVGAEEDAETARKAERNTEKVYRAALAELFNAERHVEALSRMEGNSEANTMRYVIELFKKRELYRHLSNSADRVARAASILHDIVVKIS